MSLKLLQAGIQPIGIFDGLDAQVTSFKGGEVCTFTSVEFGGSDKGAADLGDGYSGTSSKVRPAVTLTLASGARPLFLADEGDKGYGTLFGEVVGATVGQVATGGTRLGPHTAAASGKITLWNSPGLYGVSLDAVDTTDTTGLVVDNPNLNAGDPLYATTAGLLTPNSGAQFENVVVARFIEFASDGSLVNTPVSLVSALNSPSGSVAKEVPFAMAVIHWGPEL